MDYLEKLTLFHEDLNRRADRFGRLGRLFKMGRQGPLVLRWLHRCGIETPPSLFAPVQFWLLGGFLSGVVWFLGFVPLYGLALFLRYDSFVLSAYLQSMASLDVLVVVALGAAAFGLAMLGLELLRKRILFDKEPLPRWSEYPRNL